MATLFEYTITIKGRYPGEKRSEVVQSLREGISLNFPVHESIDELVIDAKSQAEETMAEMKRRFSDQ